MYQLNKSTNIEKPKKLIFIDDDNRTINLKKC